MKIACGSCGAKYSIADEKVVGKTFKLRCKRCSEVIVVAADARDVETRVESAPAAAPDAVWHVIGGGEQRGPVTPRQLAELLCGSTIDWEALAWCEGMEDWVALRDLPALVAEITGEPVAKPAPVASRASSRPARSGDLFAPTATAASPFAGVDAPSAPASSATALASTPLATGARNESSVLFSLANLQSLAGARPQARTAASSAQPEPAPPSLTSRNGSGLIDIRALVAAQGAPASAPATADALAPAATPPAFAPLFGSPVLMPAKQERSNRGLVLGLSAAAIACVAVITAVTVLAIVRPAEPAMAAVPDVARSPAPAPRESTPPALAPTPAPSETRDALPQTSIAPAPEVSPAPRVSPPTIEHRPADRRGTGRHEPAAAQTPAHASPPSTAPPSPPPSHTTGDRDVNRVLADMFGDGTPNATRPPPPAHDAPSERLPEQPARDQVLAALRALQPAIRACGAGQHGTAMTSISVSGATGRVSSASVSGAFQGTPVAACVARAARDGRFPRFSRSSFSVTFPFAI